ncbi:LuxR family transcriptional regulator [Sphingosinicella terrae]|uniref:LuxR family transcriptional regulator n=1 Tax=Sphingosinicella terrae TaxID=2172047 RepID=UPI000E0D2E4B|nr:LuxR family transcriptional regulator [Sphingosinicella terrae]
MSYSGLVDEFDRRVALCESDLQLRALLDEVMREMGFDYFALLHHASLGRRATGFVRVDSYPEGWEEELVGSGLIGCDPVHVASGRTQAAFRWDELGRFAAIGPLQREVLERSARFGLGTGFTVPANVPGEPAGSCSFAVRRGRGLPRPALGCAELVGAHAFRAARRLRGMPADVASTPRLSRREAQCLQFVAAGKTDWEIAMILGIGHETARQYVKSLRRRLGVVSRAQLAVRGLRDGLISF